MKKKGMSNGLIVGALAFIALLVIGGVLLGVISIGPGGGGTGSEDDGTVYVDDNLGDTATVTLNAYDKAADSETEVYPTWTVLDSEGTKVVNDATANSTTSVTVGDSVDTYGTGTTYYCQPLTAQNINKVSKTLEMDCWTGAAEASMDLDIYDENMNELTADDNATNENDYSATLGADEDKILIVKLTNKDDDSAYWLGAFCTFAGNDIDDFIITDSDWVEIAMPDEVSDATWAIKNDAGTDQTGDWDHCYKPKDSNYIQLDEWKNVEVEALIEAGSTNPAANGGDIGGIMAVDYSYNVFAGGTVQGGIHDGSDDEDIGNMGCVDEGTELTDAFGGDIISSVEGL